MRDISQRHLTTGELAAEFSVHAATIRRWEREGVIPAAIRRRGQRVYTADDVKRIREAVYAPPATVAEAV